LIQEFNIYDADFDVFKGGNNVGDRFIKIGAKYG
jgi:hypothetical protein